VRSCYEYQNKGLIKPFVLMLLYALVKTADIKAGRVSEVRYGISFLRGSFKSAVQGSAGGICWSSKLWYSVLNT
jgi:hypothetical protein